MLSQNEILSLTKVQLKSKIIESINNSSVELFNALKANSHCENFHYPENFIIQACTVPCCPKSVDFLKNLYSYAYAHWDFDVSYRDYVCAAVAVDNNYWEYFDLFLEFSHTNKSNLLNAVLLSLSEDGLITQFKTLHEKDRYSRHLEPMVEVMLEHAAMNGHANIIDYILDTPHYKNYLRVADKKNLYQKILSNACHTNQYELLEHLFSHKKIKPYIENPPYKLFFKSCHLNYREMVKFFIIDYNLPTPSQELLKENLSQKHICYEYVMDLFAKRKMKESLEVKLNDNTSNNKPIKI